MSAPPHAQAHSFAKAMRTDMIVPLFPLLARDARWHVQRIARTQWEESAKQTIKCNAINGH
jgi:hypothetical protein